MKNTITPQRTLSQFGEKFRQQSAIGSLMHDLDQALNGSEDEYCMLGGGNPAFIPKAQAIFEGEMEALIQSRKFHTMIGAYNGPQGEMEFIRVLRDFFNERFNWNLSIENIALTNGSQNSFFFLFNALAGHTSDGGFKKILFPMSPEYVGYADAGISEDMFVSVPTIIEKLDNQQFKYHIDFNNLPIDESIAAICLSRPCNPTGNVISNEELYTLKKLADQHGIPLIIDNAYGQPFPNVIHSKADLIWDENTILCMSLSKLGLPGARTGIIIAAQDLVEVISELSGIITLAPNSVGATLMTRMIESREITPLIEDIIKPYYHQKLTDALTLFKQYFSDLPVRIHKPEGAFFLWLWCENLPISSHQLYQKLKEKKVLAIPGESFFINIDPSWQHSKECLRINYTQSYEQVSQGLKIISETLNEIYQNT